MTQATELTEKVDIANQLRGISEYTSHEEGDPFVVRYTSTIPDEETLRKLIGLGERDEMAHYLSAVFVRIDGETEVLFGHARIHHELVSAIEQEKGKKVDDWVQAQLEIDGDSLRFYKIGLRGGFGKVEDNLKLLLGRINPQVFLSQDIPITVWTQLETYTYDPIQRELKENVRGVALGKTITNTLGKVEPLY